jgi:hypothetical protein
MSSTLKADSERRKLVRERRQARIERKQQRRDARELKRSHIDATAPVMSTGQQAAEERVDAAVERIVSEALERHDEINPPRPAPPGVDAPAVAEPCTGPAQSAADSPNPNIDARAVVRVEVTEASGDSARRPRRESDIAAFRERRRQAADDARAEARERIARAGELACVADALAALAHPDAGPWDAERWELEQALERGRIADVGAVARHAMWSISRDAARTSRRARRDPDLALAACVAYAIIARLPRTALRSAQRTHPAPEPRGSHSHPFWR